MIETLETTDNLDEKTGAQLFEECFVDLDKPIKPLDVMIYYGYDDKNKRVPVFTRGEISAIVAKSKTKKSFNKSLIEAAYIGGNSEDYTDHIRGNRKTDGYIISIDTEQGEFYSVNTFKRVERIVGNRHEKYKPFRCRKNSVKDRIKLIDYVLNESEYAGNIDIVFIDGIADLVTDTNNIVLAVELSELLMKWTEQQNCHICVVIHKAGNTDKARGHLGTAVQIKAESVIIMDNLTDDSGNIIDTNTVKIRSGYSRGIPFNEFYLSVNDEGLPFTHSDPEDNFFKKLNNVKMKPISLSDAFDVDKDDIPF